MPLQIKLNKEKATCFRKDFSLNFCFLSLPGTVYHNLEPLLRYGFIYPLLKWLHFYVNVHYTFIQTRQELYGKSHNVFAMFGTQCVRGSGITTGKQR